MSEECFHKKVNWCSGKLNALSKVTWWVGASLHSRGGGPSGIILFWRTGNWGPWGKTLAEARVQVGLGLRHLSPMHIYPTSPTHFSLDLGCVAGVSDNAELNQDELLLGQFCNRPPIMRFLFETRTSQTWIPTSRSLHYPCAWAPPVINSIVGGKWITVVLLILTSSKPKLCVKTQV